MARVRYPGDQKMMTIHILNKLAVIEKSQFNNRKMITKILLKQDKISKHLQPKKRKKWRNHSQRVK